MIYLDLESLGESDGEGHRDRKSDASTRSSTHITSVGNGFANTNDKVHLFV